jgi:hypothetical protein
MYIPIDAPQQFVQVWFALFAVVVVRNSRLLHDAHTPAMLPDLAIIALNEQSATIVGRLVHNCDGTALRSASDRRVRGRTRIFLEPTDASCRLLVLNNLILGHIFNFGVAVLVVIKLPLAATELWWLAGSATRLLAGILRCE